MKRILLLVLMLSSVCFGTDYFVDPSQTDDTGDGLTELTAKKNITAAIATASDGDTIKLIAGTYNDSTQEWGIQLPKKTLTFEPNGTENVTLTRSSEGLTYWWYCTTDCSKYRYNFNNINFVSTRSGSWLFYIYTDRGGNFELTDCSFDIEPDSIIFTAYQDCGQSYERRFIQNNCTVVSKAFSVSIYSARNMALFYINGGTINSTGTSEDQLFSLAFPRGNTIFRDVTINGYNCIKISQSVGYPYGLAVDNCTFNAVNDFDGTAIYVDYNWYTLPNTVVGAQITNNTILNYKYGIWSGASGSLIKGNQIYARDPIIIYGGSRNSIINNSVCANDTDTNTARCILFNRCDTADELDPNDYTVTDTTVTSTTAWDLSEFVVDGKVKMLFKTTSGAKPAIYYGIVESADDSTDTITVKEWIKVSDGSVETPPDTTYYVSATYFPQYNRVVNNIFDGNNSTYVMTFDFNPLDGGNYINNNCYNVQSGKSLSNIANSGQSNLAELQATWLVWPENVTDGYLSSSRYNDIDSIEADPLFKDAAGGDYEPLNSLTDGIGAVDYVKQFGRRSRYNPRGK